MIQITDHLLPAPREVKPGKAGKFFRLGPGLEYRTNCASTRICSCLETLSVAFNGGKPLQMREEPTPKESSEQYPVGLIAPETYLYFQISPKHLSVSQDAIFKTIHWNFPWNVEDYRATDEYHLIVSEFIQITARSERGLFYGLQTLSQLFPSSNIKIPFQVVHDQPALAIRAVHIDLKANRPTLDYLKELAEILATWKINTFVVEWEDKFPFTGQLSVINHPAAMTVGEKDEFLRHCRDNFIEAIPLIQSLGHLEYVLGHEEFHHLSEMHGHTPNNKKETKLKDSMICPLNEAAVHLIMEMHEQITKGMTSHTESRFVHIGMDETRLLGFCPRCRGTLGEEIETGKSKLFVDHLNRVAGWHLARGRRPIVWCDMLIQHPDFIPTIDDRVIICDWEYEQPLPLVEPRIVNIDPTGTTIDWVRTWERKTMTELESNPPGNETVFMDNYWRAGKNSSLKFPLTAFPYTEYFHDQGFDVISAPAVQMGVKTPLCPGYAQQIPNIVYFNHIAALRGALGSLCTNWVIRESFWPMLLYGFAVHAETTWTGKIAENSKLAQKFFHTAFLPSLEGETEDLYKILSEMFSNLGKVGRDYEFLFKTITKQPFTTYDIPLDEIWSVMCEKASSYEDLLQSVESQIQRNKPHFQAIQLVVHTVQLYREALDIIPSIEQIALDFDAESEKRYPSPERLQNRLRRLQALENNTKILRSKWEESFSWCLHPLEIPHAVNFRIQPIEEEITALSGSLQGLSQAINKFVSRVIDLSMKRLQS